MRNRITKPKTIRRLEALVGKPVALALTRGGTGHRIDIGCMDGTVYELFPGEAPVLRPQDRYDPVRKAILLDVDKYGAPPWSTG